MSDSKRSITCPALSRMHTACNCEAQSIPATTSESCICLPLRLVRKHHQVSTLLLDAHCKALEAHGPIASPNAGPPDPVALLLALKGRASVTVARQLPGSAPTTLAVDRHTHTRSVSIVTETGQCRHECLTSATVKPRQATSHPGFRNQFSDNLRDQPACGPGSRTSFYRRVDW